MREQIANFIQEKDLKRKTLRLTQKTLTATTLLAASFGYEKLSHGEIVLNPPETPTYSQSSPEDSERLAFFNPITVAHRAGNSKEDMEKAAKTGAEYADADLNKIAGKLYFNHGKYVEVDLKIAKFTPGGFDLNTLSPDLYAPELTAKEAFKKAKEVNIGLFVQLKSDRGGFTSSDIEELYDLSQKNNVPLVVFSGVPGYANMALNKLNEMEDSPEKQNIKVLTMFKNSESWNEVQNFLALGGNGVLTDKHLANSYKAELKDSFVIVEDVNSPESVFEAEDSGVVNGFMAKLPVLANIFYKTQN